MSDLTYDPTDSSRDKPLVWLDRGINSPPFSPSGRVEAGYRLRRLQQGELLSMPHSRPMPVIAEVFDKSSRQTPRMIIELCRKRLWAYDQRAQRGQQQ